MSRINEISPAFIGEDRITISLDEFTQTPTIERPITVLFDYGDAEPEGIVLPLVFSVQSAFDNGSNSFRRVFKAVAPKSFTFKVFGVGQYLLLIKEAAHNQWQGRLLINVAGDEFAGNERF